MKPSRSRLEREIVETLGPGMSLPEPLPLLFGWIECNGFFVDVRGQRFGCLAAPQDRRVSGTDITFYAEANNQLAAWFGRQTAEITSRVSVFARTGADGSMAALWIDDDGRQRVVHMGSGSGSTLTCVLADDAVDFLRLLAIGYAEICWGGFSDPPLHEPESTRASHNDLYRGWVEATFRVDTPASGEAVVRHENYMEDVEPADSFCRWVSRVTG